jgi:DNA polymerase III subunit delta'
MTAYFSHIIGNEHIKHYLINMVDRNAVANSLLFAGPDGIGKSLFAEAFAKLLLCSNDPEGIHCHKIESGSHPDVRIYHPEGKIGMHSIDSMRQFSEEVYLSPYEGLWKVFIIHDADRMLSYSANALLKTFEEPAPRSLIILLSSNPKALLPTVLSRCRTLRFHLPPERAVQHLTTQIENPIRTKLLQVLALGKMSSYSQLMETASEIGDLLDARKLEVEQLTRSELLKAYPKDITSVQQHNHS